jgi:hypothetical protein
MDVSVYGISLIPVIIGLVQLLSQFGIPKKLLPLSSMVMGIILGIVFLAPDDWKKGILVGIWLGLGATGMHSGVKNTMNGYMKKKNK